MRSRGRLTAIAVIVMVVGAASVAAALAGEAPDSSGEGLAVAAPARPLAAVPIEEVDNYLVVGGTQFHSDHTNLTHSQTTGCVYTEQSDNLVAVAALPDGAVVTEMEMEYIDSSFDGSATLWLTTYDAAGLTDVAQVATAGSVGRGTVVVQFSHTVDNEAEVLGFNWRPTDPSVDLQLCSVRLRYTVPNLTLWGEDATLLVETGEVAQETRTLARFRNNGRVRVEMVDDSTLNNWHLAAGNGAFDIFNRDDLGRLRLSDDGKLFVGIAGNTRMRLDASGNLRLDGSLTQGSDVSIKEGFAPVDAEAILDALLAMDITTWSYIEDDGSVVHLGPTAQDFHAAFGLGEDPTGIAAVDADGVAMVSIQALAELLEQKDADLESMEARLMALEEAVADLLAGE